MKPTFFLAAILSLASTVFAAEDDKKKGWSGKLSTLDGGLEGTVTVDDTSSSLTVTDYKLEDASAPALYWWGSASSSLSDGFRISNKHVTEPSGDSNTYTIELDAGKTTADFVTVGLWCEKFSANFGQATLAPVEGADKGSPSGGSDKMTPTPTPTQMSNNNAGVSSMAVEWAWVGVSVGLSAFTFLLR